MADPGLAPGGAPNPKLGLFCKFLAENCMKMKEFGPRERISGAPLRSANVSRSRSWTFVRCEQGLSNRIASIYKIDKTKIHRTIPKIAKKVIQINRTKKHRAIPKIVKVTQ